MLFESHITVDVSSQTIESFKELCDSIDLKYLIITDDSGTDLPTQAMTKKFYKTTLEDARTQTDELTVFLSSSFPVLRSKLERVTKKPSGLPFLYEEYHIKVEPFEGIEQVVSELGGHTSKNAANPASIFATFRSAEQFSSAVSTLKPTMYIREEIVYDSAPHLDSKWVCGDCVLKMRSV